MLQGLTGSAVMISDGLIAFRKALQVFKQGADNTV